MQEKFTTEWLLSESKDFTQKKGAKFIEDVCSGLNVKLKSDLTAICTHGPKVMVKMGKILGIIYTLCMAHSLH